MAKIFKTSHRVKLPKSQHEVEEFGGGKKGLVFCSECKAAYYKKSWHHGILDFKSNKEDAPVKFLLCPACQMIKNNQHEGKITIKNIPAKIKDELINLIKGFCNRAYRQDPMDRLIVIKEDGGNLVVTVTENQLANKLAKKIKSTFNNVKTKTFFDKEPGDVALVEVEFLK